MSDLGNYFLFSSLVFLLDMICDIIFYSTFSNCGISSNPSAIYLILILLNTPIFIFMFVVGLLIRYFGSMDPADMKDMGMFKNILAIITKFLPTLVKLLHILKLLIYFILCILTIVVITGDLKVTDVSIDTCGSNSERRVVNNMKQFALVFFGIESFSICFATCVLGTIKSFITEDGFLYNPLPSDAGVVRKTCMKVFGP